MARSRGWRPWTWACRSVAGVGDRLFYPVFHDVHRARHVAAGALGAVATGHTERGRRLRSRDRKVVVRSSTERNSREGL